MSERKVLQKYYPPDFDPSAITRSKKPKGIEKKLPTVRLMAPFPMKCTSCAEFIYRGRKFNARKETTDMKYLNIPIYRFYIKCTRCSAQISFRTNPRTMDYDCESGAQRSFEKWRQTGEENANNLETEEEMLDRLEAEQAAEGGGVLEDLEQKVHDAKTEMEIADALDEIRTRNARIQRAEGKGEQDAAVAVAEKARRDAEGERRRVEEEDERAARRAFGRLDADIEVPMEDVEEEVGGGRPRIGGSGLRIETFADDDGGDDGNLGGVSPGQSTSAGDAGGEDASGTTLGVSTAATIPNMTSTAVETSDSMPPPPSFKRVVKKKKDFSAALGIKKKPSLV